MTLSGKKIAAIVPAYNEASAIAAVVTELLSLSHEQIRLIDEVVVVDNNSTDDTASIASSCGARVIREPRKGYGSACLAGIHAAPDADILVFVDGDYSFYSADVLSVCCAVDNDTDMVIGSRTLGCIEEKAMPLVQYYGNALLCLLIRLRFATNVSDLGPLRAIYRHKLLQLDVQDLRFGWTLEMQVKAIQQKIRIKEIPVRLRARIGHSKISGTWSGALLAGFDLLKIIFKSL